MSSIHLLETALDLDTALRTAREAVGGAHAALDHLQALLADQQAQLQHALADAADAQALAGYDRTLLQQFFTTPYVLLPNGVQRWLLVVPRFVGLRAGWPITITDAYAVYEVSRWTELLAPTPAWLREQLGLGTPPFQAIIDGLDLQITSGDPQQAYTLLGGSKSFSRRQGDVLRLRPASRITVLRRLIREAGVLPFAAAPVPESLRRPSAVARDAAGVPLLQLRPYQQTTYAELLARGAATLIARPQLGKSYVVLQALADVAGPKLLVAPGAASWRSGRPVASCTLRPRPPPRW